jgi:nicotinate-nucleotide adenylyltransferase
MDEANGKPGGIGVLGGTFNPIHRGHVHAALAVADRLGLERVILVPASVPPLKQGGSEVMAPAEDRLAWARLAVASHAQLEVDPLELEREGPSYSYETIRILAERLGERPVFIIGQDAFVDLPAWREPEALLTLCHFAVMPRPPVNEGTVAEWLPARLAGDFEFAADGMRARHRSAGTWIRQVPIDALDVSATEVRRRLAAGEPVNDLLPGAVADAVDASGIYSLATGNDKVTTPEEDQQVRDRTRALCESVLELKAQNVIALDLRALSAFADSFVLATGTSDRHVRAIADQVIETAKKSGAQVLGVEGYNEGEWVLIDLNDAVVHVFRGPAREHYDLDLLWGDAPRLFESVESETAVEEAGA